MCWIPESLRSALAVQHPGRIKPSGRADKPFVEISKVKDPSPQVPDSVTFKDGSCFKSPFLMGKSTISMAILNSYVSLPEGISH